DQGELVFFVQPDLALVGENNVLEIPALDMKINYTVNQTILPDTPEETLAPFIDHLSGIETTGINQGEKVQIFLESFQNYYASLSAAEKTTMAEFYHANPDLFGSLILGERATTFAGLSECETAKFMMATLGSAAVILSNPATIGL